MLAVVALRAHAAEALAVVVLELERIGGGLERVDGRQLPAALGWKLMAATQELAQRPQERIAFDLAADLPMLA